MIAAVIRKELRGFLRDGRLLVLAMAMLCVLAGALAASVVSNIRSQTQRDAIDATARAQWEQQGDKNPHRAAHFGIYVFKPSLMLAALDPGIGEQVGQSLWLEPHKRNPTRHSRDADAPSTSFLGELTPIFVLVALVPLLIIAMGHNSVSHERETGTLRMLHAAGLQGRDLLVGKWLAVLLATGLALLPVALLALGSMVLLSADEALRLVFVVLSLTVYYAVFAALTVAVSARLRTSRGALLLLLSIWIGALWVVPRLGAAGAEAVLPVPTGISFSRQIADDIRTGLPGDGDAASRMAAFDARMLADYKVSSLNDLPFGANAARRLYRDAYAAQVYALHFDRLWDRYAAQQNILRIAGLFSPVIPLRGVSSAMAGTDLAHQRHFEEQAEIYRQAFTEQIDQWDLQARRGVVSAEDRYGGESVWMSVKPFEYRSPALGFALEQACSMC